MLSEDYTVQLDVFEGPLDLLLYLIKRDEIDIYDIPIEYVTKQYVEYLNLMKMLDLNIAGEFLVMSATLMMIKSRMLLPVDERPELEEDEDDPRYELVRQLVEYKKFKDAAIHLEGLELGQQNVFAHEADGVDFGKDPGAALKDVNIFDLIAAFNNALEKAKDEDIREIFHEAYSVQEQLGWMLKKLHEDEKIPLSELFTEMRSREQIVCTFLAVLELIKLRRIRAAQDAENFGAINIVRIEDDEADELAYIPGQESEG